MADREESQTGHHQSQEAWRDEVGRKETRKVKARRQKDRSIWFGFGMFGMVGWSVAIPTVIGAALGLWIDRKWPSRYSWTLILLVIGLVIGCINAWQWVKRESRNE